MVLKANLRKRKENLENHNDLILNSERWIRGLKKRDGVRKIGYVSFNFRVKKKVTGGVRKFAQLVPR